MVVVSGFAFETVEQVVRVDEGVVDVNCLIHGAGEEFVEADYGFVPLVADKLRPEMFYDDHHQLIFAALIAMYQANKKIDILRGSLVW